MEFSVVIPTLNARDQLACCLDSITEHVPHAEVIVVNGPSSDGTTGMVRERDDVDVLIELADRTIPVARNAGIDRASRDVIAFVDHMATVTPGWADALEVSFEESHVVTGPTDTQVDGDDVMTKLESRSVAGRDVTYFNAGNVAFDRHVLDELDGFDEFLQIGGSRDLAHRLAGKSFEVEWREEMRVSREFGTDGGKRESDWGWKYRSLAYRLVKNYNLRPTVVRRLVGHAVADGYTEFRSIARGETAPSEWLGSGKRVVTNLAGGVRAGLGARRRDRTQRRNPWGRSSRADREVTVYDWR